MRTLIALGLLLVAAAAVALTLHFYPAASSPNPVDAKPTLQAEASPTEVVISYLKALERKDYRRAYALLSADSCKTHPYEDFVARAEKSGLTEYDLTTAKEAPPRDRFRTVTLQLKEDPAQAGFNLVQDTEAWNVVFIGGIPSCP